MRAEEQFDSFYLKTRRALVHQTFALTGDLAAAQRAVRDAYVAAWHHWRKVKHADDQAGWVRPRAWALAQRRHTARLWHRTRDLSEADRAALDALHKLPLGERRALLLVDLAGLAPEAAAREIGVTRDVLRQQVQVGRARFAAVLDVPPEQIGESLARLGDAATRASLPRPAVVRRQGRNRRRTHTVAATVAATLVALASGAFAHQLPDEDLSAQPLESEPLGVPDESASVAPVPEPTLPTGDDLLSVSDVERLAPAGRWREVETHDNTGGDGINYVCQQQRFADPDGLATIVRKLETRRGPEHSVVQVVEISESPSQAEQALETIESWFATCKGGELHLLQTHAVRNVADEAMLVELRPWDTSRGAYVVAVARVGEVVTTTAVRAAEGAPRPAKVARMLATATRMLCERMDGGDCSGRPRLRAVPPPSSDEAPGMLTTVDLPPLSDVTRPWVGTEPSPAPRNPAATSCDRAEFRRAGAERTRTRTFLVPEGRLPDRFGLTETYGTFPTKKAAARFLATVRDRFAGCEDRDLATEVLVPTALRTGPLDGGTWRLRTELSENREVIYDVGFVRRGRSVAQVTFVPAGPADLSDGSFRALVVRAGQRLADLD